MFRRTLASHFFNPLPGVGRLNHVAIAVPKEKDILQVAKMYAGLVGASISEKVDQPEHGVTTVFIDLPNTKLELLHPLGDKSPIAAFLAKNKEGGMHHICLDVDDMATAMERVKEAGIRPLGVPKTGAHGLPVIFLHPKDCGGVLIELEEHKELQIKEK